MNEASANQAGLDGQQAEFPVRLVVEKPQLFERAQLLLRIPVMILLSALHQPFGGTTSALYFILPVVAAVLISQHGKDEFLTNDSKWMRSALEWVIGLFAYLMLVTDRVPLGPNQRQVCLEVRPGGTPSVPTALIRFLTTLPHLLALAVLCMVSVLIWFYAAFSVLLTENYPSTLQRFQQAVLSWMARVFAYHCSLVEEYPPFAIDSESASRPLATCELEITDHDNDAT